MRKISIAWLAFVLAGCTAEALPPNHDSTNDAITLLPESLLSRFRKRETSDTVRLAFSREGTFEFYRKGDSSWTAIHQWGTYEVASTVSPVTGITYHTLDLTLVSARELTVTTDPRRKAPPIEKAYPPGQRPTLTISVELSAYAPGTRVAVVDDHSLEGMAEPYFGGVDPLEYEGQFEAIPAVAGVWTGEPAAHGRTTIAFYDAGDSTTDLHPFFVYDLNVADGPSTYDHGEAFFGESQVFIDTWEHHETFRDGERYSHTLDANSLTLTRIAVEGSGPSRSI
jgi:hypothetical protein